MLTSGRVEQDRKEPPKGSWGCSHRGRGLEWAPEGVRLGEGSIRAHGHVGLVCEMRSASALNSKVEGELGFGPKGAGKPLASGHRSDLIHRCLSKNPFELQFGDCKRGRGGDREAKVEAAVEALRTWASGGTPSQTLTEHAEPCARFPGLAITNDQSRGTQTSRNVFSGCWRPESLRQSHWARIRCCRVTPPPAFLASSGCRCCWPPPLLVTVSPPQSPAPSSRGLL